MKIRARIKKTVGRKKEQEKGGARGSSRCAPLSAAALVGGVRTLMVGRVVVKEGVTVMSSQVKLADCTKRREHPKSQSASGKTPLEVNRLENRSAKTLVSLHRGALGTRLGEEIRHRVGITIYASQYLGKQQLV